MTTDSNAHACMLSLFQEQCRSLQEADPQLTLSQDLEVILSAWLDKESNFTFLEDERVPQEPTLALKFSEALTQVDLIWGELLAVRAAREDEGLDQLPQGYACIARSLDELDWIEGLYEDEVIADDHPALIKHALSGARRLKDMIMTWCVKRAELPWALSYERTSLLTQEAREALNDRGDWVWRQRFLSLPLTRSEAWRPLADEGSREALISEAEEALTAQLQALRDTWRSEGEQLQATLAAPFHEALWESHLAPIASEWAMSQLEERFTAAISEDLADVFEPLACAPRPKDHRVGALAFGGEGEREVTVIFTKRDGQILAQRDLTWDPLDLEGVCEAFQEIKIRTLVAPEEVPPHVERALEALRARYEIARVSSLAISEITRPVGLTHEAKLALQLAQRYVAPLRFWARVDVLKLAEELLPSELSRFILEDEARSEQLKATLKARVDAQWVVLRRRRNLRRESSTEQRRSTRASERSSNAPPREAPLAPQRSQEDRDQQARPQRERSQGAQRSASHRAKGSSRQRGERVEVKLTEVEPYRLRGELLSHEQPARLAMITLSGHSALLKQRYEVGQVIEAYVIHDHPKQACINLTLRPLRAHDGPKRDAERREMTSHAHAQTPTNTAPTNTAATNKKKPNSTRVGSHHKQEGKATQERLLEQSKRDEHATLSTLSSLFSGASASANAKSAPQTPAIRQRKPRSKG